MSDGRKFGVESTMTFCDRGCLFRGRVLPEPIEWRKEQCLLEELVIASFSLIASSKFAVDKKMAINIRKEAVDVQKILFSIQGTIYYRFF